MTNRGPVRLLTAAVVLVAALATYGQQPERSGIPQPGPPVDVGAFRFRRSVTEGKGLVAVRLDAAVLAHSRGPAGGFPDVRLVDAAGRQIPYLVERLEQPLAVKLSLQGADSNIREIAPEPGRHRSIYRLRFPYRSLPAASLELQTSARVFARSVRLGVERAADRRHREAWFDSRASREWAHVHETSAAPPLLLPLGSLDEEHMLIVVEEGDNSPLPITSVRLLLPAFRIRFYHPGGRIEMLYGNDDLPAPRYDLGLLSADVLGAPATEVALGEEPDQRKGGADERPLVSRQAFWAGLSVAVVILAVLIVRLMRARD